MKTKLSPRILNFSGLVVIGMAIGFAETTTPAQAGYVVTLSEVGSDVVATGSGAIDLTGLAFQGNVQIEETTFIVPAKGEIFTGPPGHVARLEQYSGSGFTGPRSFGSGFGTSSDTGTGSFVDINGFAAYLLVPQGYVSDDSLSDSMTFNGATFSSLGVTPGKCEWRWGTGVDQNFTVQIGAPPPKVPDHGWTVGLLLLGFGALFGVSRGRLLRFA